MATDDAVIRQLTREKTEDEIDLELYDEAMDCYQANPVTYSLDEVEKELDILKA